MTRDSFDLFQPRERGRFGDNEYSNPRVNAGAKSTLVDLDLPYAGQSPHAVAVRDARAAPERPGEGTRRASMNWIWLPKSQVEFEMIDKGTVRVTLPRWLAKEKGLV